MKAVNLGNLFLKSIAELYAVKKCAPDVLGLMAVTYALFAFIHAYLFSRFCLLSYSSSTMSVLASIAIVTKHSWKVYITVDDYEHQDFIGTHVQSNFPGMLPKILAVRKKLINVFIDIAHQGSFQHSSGINTRLG